MKKDLLEYFFHKYYDKFVGFEVADRTIKAIYLSKKKDIIYLENGVVYKLKPNIIVENQIKEESQLVDIFNDIKQELMITNDDFPIGMSFPGQSTVSKVLKVNKNLHGSEQENFIQQEISKQLHKKDIDICMDYYIFNKEYNIDGTVNENNPFYDVIAVSALQKDIDQRVEIAKASNLSPQVIDIDYLAIAGAANFLLPDEYKDVTAFFYLGHCTISLIVMSKFNVIYSKEATIDAELWQYLAYDIDSVLQNKTEPLKDKKVEHHKENEQHESDATRLPDNYTEILVSGDVINQFADQCLSLLQFFYSSQKGIDVKKMVLVGCFNTEKEDIILQSLNEKLNIAGDFLSFKNKIVLSDIAQDNKILQRIAPDMMISFGVALRGFDDD